jgi:hypothetical protein
MGVNTMKIKIDKPGIYELNFVENLPIDPPVVQPPVIEPEPTPEPPTEPIEPPQSDITGKLIELFSDLSKWSAPEQVWEFGEIAGGVYIPFTNNTAFDQRRDSSKPRFITHSPWSSRSVTSKLNGSIISPHFDDIKFHDGKAYAVATFHKELYMGVCDKPFSSRPEFNFTHVPFEGAKDTSHGLNRVGNKWHVLGRLRTSVDWGTTDPILSDRRGVRLLILDDRFEIEYNGEQYDPVFEQRGYATNQIRYDYYSCKRTYIDGIPVDQISCFAKNENRPIPHYENRQTGTGEIYPIVAVNRQILSHATTIVPKWLYTRTTDHKINHPYEPEVGQLYGYGITFDEETRRIDFYYSNRIDTHYFAPSTPNQDVCRIYRISAFI